MVLRDRPNCYTFLETLLTEEQIWGKHFGSYLFFGVPNNTIEFIAAHADWLTPQERQDKWHELFDSE